MLMGNEVLETDAGKEVLKVLADPELAIGHRVGLVAEFGGKNVQGGGEEGPGRGMHRGWHR